jgi:DNA-binding LytR/AlgR family response regulator
MPKIVAEVKAEIRRLAKQEIKANTTSMKAAVAQFRREIAKLKRLVRTQQREIALLKAHDKKPLGRPQSK